MIRDYYVVVKPGIVRANVLVAAAGFLFATDGAVQLIQFFATVIGIALVVASGCVINNVFDRRIDTHMKRTAKRPVATGSISVRAATLYGTVLGATGFVLLGLYATWVTVAVGAIGYVFYVWLYTFIKRKSVHGTLVGAVSGAIPPVAGYTAISGAIDTPAILLFCVLACWQMPHFYAIAIFRKDEYAAASIPVLSVVRGIPATVRQIIGYVILFAVSASLLSVLGYTSTAYAVCMALLSLWWFSVAVGSSRLDDPARWSKKVFGSSLVVLLGWSVLVACNSFLP